ncbi:MAG: hypothetical protein Q9217_001411 [Psora testacea]
MADNEDFTLVNASSHHKVFDDYGKIHSGHMPDTDTSLQAALRNGKSRYEAIQRYRSFLAGDSRRGIPDELGEDRSFAKYNYRWADQYFIIYIVQISYYELQYILKEPSDGETTMSTNSATDKLVETVGKWAFPDDEKYIYVYDGYWTRSRALYKEIIKANWKDVILNEDMKKTLTELMHKFFDSKEVYQDLGVPWKRGVIFYGPAGNGKTISIKALMHSLFERSGFAIPSLYVKSAPETYDIRSIFIMARYMSPCLLIFEDIDTIVTPSSRSYFFNEVDGLENNDGLFMVASTNHLDQLDPGLSSRPSRFDRKYLFPLPDLQERVSYCKYWREKLKDKPTIKFPENLCLAIAEITDGFSFAYLKEAFVATLLTIAGKRSEDDDHERKEDEGNDGDDLDRYELWREIKKQIKLLRDDMGRKKTESVLKFSGSTSVNGVKPDMLWKRAVYQFPGASTRVDHSATSAVCRRILASEPRGLPLRYSGRRLPNESIPESVRPSVENVMLDARFQAGRW